MKLQTKTLSVFLLLLIAMLIIVSMFASFVVLSSYSSLEKQYISNDLNQTIKKINDEENTLSAVVSDWGPWDDTYNYVNGKDPGYVKDNLIPDTYENLRINLVIITNSKGEIVYQGAYDPDNQTRIPVPVSLISQITPDNPLMNMSDPHQATTGIILDQPNPIIVASRPIVYTNFSGIPAGVVIMGRYLNSGEVGYLAGLTQPTLSITRLDDPALPGDLVTRLKVQGGEDHLLVLPVNGSLVGGYALLKDIYGNDDLVLGFSEPRTIYGEGLSTTFNFILVILVTGLLFGLAVIVIFNRIIMSRLDALNLQVQSVGHNHSVNERIDIGGNDEFSELAAQINLMLETIDRTRQGLQASETRFRELAELLPQIVFEMNLAGTLLYVNKTGGEQFSITPQDIVNGVNIRDYLSPENISQMERSLAAVSTGAPSPGEIYILKKPDGNRMKAVVNTSPIRRDGKIIGFRGIVFDLTRRLNLEEALEESRTYLDTLVASVHVGILVIDAGTHTIIDANPAALELIGISKNDILGKICHRFICPSEAGKCPVTDLGHTVDNSERILMNVRGDKIPIIKYVVPVELHGKRCLLETFIDNTYRKKIEAALKESEEKYRALTENTGDILFSTDMNGIVTYASPQINKYGFLVEETIGRSIYSFILPEDAEQVRNNFALELKKGAHFISTFRILDKWGNSHWFEEKSSLRLDHSGKPLGIYGILRDVSDRKHAEDAIELANKKLNLMNNITRHDILNTITGIYGCIDMAKATSSAGEREQLLNDVKDQIRLIQRQITFTREYQEVGVHLPRWQNVREVINSVLPNFEKSGLKFIIDLEKIEIYADPLLEKVFFNLIDNAARYGETITTVEIKNISSNKELTLTFEDDGVGIPSDEKARIFERGIGKNTGMGLFLSREILLITGITITENGIAGKGARFEIYIPNGMWRFTSEIQE